MAEATFLREMHDMRLVSLAALTPAGKVYQMPDGRAAVKKGLATGNIGDQGAFQTDGIFTVAKATGVVMLDGGRVYWTPANSTATFQKVNARDFYLGRAVGDSASADTIMKVNINIDPPYDISLLRDGALTVPTGTQAVGGFGFPKLVGGSQSIELAATSEAEAIDLFSVDRWSIANKYIAEFIFRPVLNGASAATQFNCGIANGTSTTDAQAITEQVLLQFGGGSTGLFAQSKDGTTTVALTDTTKTFTAGSAVANRVEVWFDVRDVTNVKIYVNGVRVLSGSTFVLTAAAGPHGLLVHLRKTTGTETAKVVIDAARVRYMQQGVAA